MSNKKTGVFKYFDCSTAHVLPADMSLLESRNIIACPDEHGAWVCVPVADHVAYWIGEFKEQGFSNNFIAVIEMALACDCYWIRFDSIGVRHDDLEDCSASWK